MIQIHLKMFIDMRMILRGYVYSKLQHKQFIISYDFIILTGQRST